MLTEWGDYLRGELDRSERTVKQYEYRVGFVEGRLAKLAEDVIPAELRRLKMDLREEGYSSSHVKGVVVAMRQYHEWGEVDEAFPPTGVAHVRTPKEENRSPRPLPHSQLRTLLDACRGPLETRVIWLPSFAGLRIAEAAGVEWEDGWIDLIGKGRKRREIPVHPRLAERREEILSFRPHPSSLQNAKERVEERTGISFVTHQLRKTFSTALHDAKVDGLCRRSLLGHALGLDGVYTEISRREKQEAVAALPY